MTNERWRSSTCQTCLSSSPRTHVNSQPLSDSWMSGWFCEEEGKKGGGYFTKESWLHHLDSNVLAYSRICCCSDMHYEAVQWFEPGFKRGFPKTLWAELSICKKCIHLSPPELLAPLVNMSKTGYENISLLFILLVFHSKYSKKSYLFIEVKLFKEKKLMRLNKYFSAKHVCHNYWHP